MKTGSFEGVENTCPDDTRHSQGYSESDQGTGALHAVGPYFAC